MEGLATSLMQSRFTTLSIWSYCFQLVTLTDALKAKTRPESKQPKECSIFHCVEHVFLLVGTTPKALDQGRNQFQFKGVLMHGC